MDVISIESLYQSVKEIISKDKAGYFSSDEFNARSKRAEIMLWNFYAKHYDEHGVIPDAMYPFNRVQVQSLDANTQFDLPDNFGRRTNCYYLKTKTVAGSAPSTEKVPMVFLEKEEEQLTLNSAVRGPSIDKKRLYYSYVNAKGQVYPEGLKGPVRFEYLSMPTFGVRGFTVNDTTLEEEPDSGSTTDYQWPVKEQPNLEDLIALQYGVMLKQTDILTWASSQIGDSRNISKL